MRKLRLFLALLLVTCSFAAMNIPAAQPAFSLLHSLFDPRTNAQVWPHEGFSVAMDGNLVVTGAPNDNTGGVSSGMARVYDATTGALLHSLTNPTPAAYDYFGRAVAISGTRVVVGATGDDAGETDSGAAYVFDLAGVSPSIPVLTLAKPGVKTDDYFGGSVAISGRLVIVGAYSATVVVGNAGLAHLYDLAGATPAVPFLTLTNPSPAVSERFGFSVAVDETRVIVGTPNYSAVVGAAGIAYVYDLTSATPAVPERILANPAPSLEARFGNAVALSGTRAVVGEYADDAPYDPPPKVHVYDLAGETPTVPMLTLTNPSPAFNDGFGASVAISGAWLAVGAPRDNAGPSDAGMAFVYDLAGAAPAVPVASFTNPSQAGDEYFGFSLAMKGTTVSIGAPLANTHARERGAAFVFRLRPALSITPSAPGLATLSWTPTNAPGFVLQYTDSLAPTNWLNAPSGARNPVTVATTNAARFYRLAQP